MKTFRVRYHLNSSVASAWHADTIFGHLAWALRYLEGEESLRDFLEWYRLGEPPLILSDGFPGDYLPNPILPPKATSALNKAKAIQAFDEAKQARQTPLLSLDEFNRAINGQPPHPNEHDKTLPRGRVTLKNQINRLTGTTGEGGNLYEFEETFWGKIPVSIYVKVAEGFKDQAERLFGVIAKQGYGKRKSVGYGAIASMQFEPFDGFQTPPEPNGFVSLSHFVPAPKDPTDGFWKVMIKYGKLGEEYGSDENPFKRPLLMLTPGSVFRTGGRPKEFYGRTVDGISPRRPEVIQYGLAFAVPAKIAT